MLATFPASCRYAVPWHCGRPLRCVGRGHPCRRFSVSDYPITPLDLKDRQIVACSLHRFEHLCSLASPLCCLVRAMRKTKDSFHLLEIQRRSSAVDELLIHLVHRRAAPEQQVATQFKLEDRILIGKAAALAVHVGERKAQAGRVDPPLAELA